MGRTTPQDIQVTDWVVTAIHDDIRLNNCCLFWTFDGVFFGLQAILSSASKMSAFKNLSGSLEEAIRDEDYFTAAELKKDLDAIKAEDVVDNFLQVS